MRSLRKLLLRRLFLKNLPIFSSNIIQQAAAIRVKVGYPISPDTENPRSIASYYGLVKIKEDEFFENILSAALVFLQHLLVSRL